MIKWETMIVGDLQTNCYIVWDEDTKTGIIIDPGEDGQGIAEEIQNKQIKPIGIVLTHGHFDHCLAALDLKLIFGIPIYLNSDDEFLLKRQDETAKYFLGVKNTPPNIVKIDKDLKDIKTIELGNQIMEVIQTPGHTPGSICLYSKENNILFSGDTIFRGERGRTDFKYGSTKKIFESIKKLMNLPENTDVLSGHGETANIGTEKSRYGLS